MSGFPLLSIERSGPGATVRTPAKINLFLEVHGRRRDGYHEVTTLMLALDWHDTIEISPSDGKDRLRVEGPAAEGSAADGSTADGSTADGSTADGSTADGSTADGSTADGSAVPTGPDNLVWKAVEAVRRRRSIPPLEIRLRKEIPPGGGFGGGSGNAAGTLALLEEVFPFAGEEGLAALGAEIGSDVPFFFTGGWALATGRGERVDPGPTPPLGRDVPWFLLVTPALASSTAAAYERVTFPLTSPDGPISFPERTFVTSKRWMTGLFNRLERQVLALHGPLVPVAEWLESTAAGRWRMTGSGSAFYVIRESRDEANGLASTLTGAWSGVSLTTQVVRVSAAVAPKAVE